MINKTQFLGREEINTGLGIKIFTTNISKSVDNGIIILEIEWWTANKTPPPWDILSL